MMKYAYVNEKSVLTGWGYSSENGSDVVREVDDDFELQPGKWKWDNDWVEFQPLAIPQSVSAAQGGIALIQAGLMEGVQSVVDAADTPAEVKWAWGRAQDWQRNSPALAYLAQRAGISDEQMDDLFIAASEIQA